MVTRGEVWLAALNPTIGSEIQKTRPCLVISPAEMHDHLRTVIVAPMTSANRPAGFRVPVTFQGVDGLILLDQTRSVDRKRLIRLLGMVPPPVLKHTLKTLREIYED
ncbi:mRNA interferase MazF [Pararhizobium capsulatum DSM 1112]|uniref:mRNA interferase MazF n=1 Tax=Pararhizobium capsulatum DSM 1112 TaxID=1121113 RepID=A0ABU0BWC2_9HYPH|nr:type II toxin-antitoxin system PemK/MazF family toxin [Pararhizobium capsulatum]MDQ0322555.1 mRNA interferase MazF [Pararhizobium capsulatum DSM 1112]